MIFFSIHAHDNTSMCHLGDDEIDNGILYTTFEIACHEIEKEILKFLEKWRNKEEGFAPPNREEKRVEIMNEGFTNYHRTDGGMLFTIRKWVVSE